MKLNKSELTSIIKNNKIVLRKLNLGDIKDLADLCNNKNIWDNLRDFIPYPYTEELAKSFIEFCLLEDVQTTFAIELNDKFAGVIDLILKDDIYKLSAEIGYWIGEQYWGKGIATEAVKMIVNYGFTKLNLLRIFTGVIDRNIASRKVLEKAGFKLDCIFEKAILKNNIICDEYRYSILNNNYKEVS